MQRSDVHDDGFLGASGDYNLGGRILVGILFSVRQVWRYEHIVAGIRPHSNLLSTVVEYELRVAFPDKDCGFGLAVMVVTGHRRRGYARLTLHSFSAPVLWCVIAANRCMPDVCPVPGSRVVMWCTRAAGNSEWNSSWLVMHNAPAGLADRWKTNFAEGL